MIFFTCSLVRRKSSARISSLSCTKMLPSMRSRAKKLTTSSERPMKRRHLDTSSSDSAERSAGGSQGEPSPLGRGAAGGAPPSPRAAGGTSMTPCAR
ncbi:hypothetical protein AV530_017826 [Patagioenas fasciata monilis]|uniref:Uncharacterized protein n=1 Tax=Patagioenas fasciata monilis TaxID=372326 RepID=A0A1V4KPW4_PATFA|nr:hypothetical protein AV530_017826 [Patagioenas fasciata monilis]